ncbi:MAG: hypothetical protein M3P18_10205 [Actinomycetota bacterium]|nr:hypothetical protein [Actinomycetota bacterium]
MTVRTRDLTGPRARKLTELFAALHRGRGDELNVHACDLLADSADWNASTWDFTLDGSRQLSEMVEAVFADAPDDLELTALWGGDRAQVERDVTREQILDLIRASKLETRATYRIRR